MVGSKYKVGETTGGLSPGRMTQVTVPLKVDELKVAGKGIHRVTALNRGSTAFGTGIVSGFVVVPGKPFIWMYSTDMYVPLRCRTAKDLTAYTGAYMYGNRK
ncbi:MAG: hypothetical protein ACLU80_16295 [Dorea sp.]